MSHPDYEYGEQPGDRIFVFKDFKDFAWRVIGSAYSTGDFYIVPLPETYNKWWMLLLVFAVWWDAQFWTIIMCLPLSVILPILSFLLLFAPESTGWGDSDETPYL